MIHDTFQFISCTGPNFNWPGQAVQYKYRLYEAKRTCHSINGRSLEIMLIDPLSWSTYGENLDFQAKLGVHAYDR